MVAQQADTTAEEKEARAAGVAALDEKLIVGSARGVAETIEIEVGVVVAPYRAGRTRADVDVGGVVDLAGDVPTDPSLLAYPPG